MNLRDRLERLTSVSKPDQEDRSQVLHELREKLDRLLEPRKIYKKGDAYPIEHLVQGEIVSTPYGEGFQVKEHFPSDYRCGEITLAEILGHSHLPGPSPFEGRKAEGDGPSEDPFSGYGDNRPDRRNRDVCLHDRIGFFP